MPSEEVWLEIAVNVMRIRTALEHPQAWTRSAAPAGPEGPAPLLTWLNAVEALCVTVFADEVHPEALGLDDARLQALLAQSHAHLDALHTGSDAQPDANVTPAHILH